MTVDPRGYEQSRTQTQGIGPRCLGRISYFRSGGICRGCPVDALHEDLESAIDHLLRSGFHRAELSLLASEHTVAKKLGHHYRRAIDAGDDSSLPRAAFVSTAAIGDAESERWPMSARRWRLGLSSSPAPWSIGKVSFVVVFSTTYPAAWGYFRS